MALISELCVYPVKSLDPHPVEAVRVLPTGALEYDRRWALFDAGGAFINGKSRATLHALRARFDLARGEVQLADRTLSLVHELAALEHFLSEWLNEPVFVRENTISGFPDDTASPGPTFVSRASLVEVAGWFGLDLESTRLRFRTNVEVDGTEAFWEDHLYGHFFDAGAVRLEAVNPCQRCAVPTRDARTGAVLTGFQKHFVARRQATLPNGANRDLFTHFYRLAVNTRRVAGAEAVLRRGEPVRRLR
jgi:uncharacterized protein YcbX